MTEIVCEKSVNMMQTGKGSARVNLQKDEKTQMKPPLIWFQGASTIYNPSWNNATLQSKKNKKIIFFKWGSYLENNQKVQIYMKNVLFGQVSCPHMKSRALAGVNLPCLWAQWLEHWWRASHTCGLSTTSSAQWHPFHLHASPSHCPHTGEKQENCFKKKQKNIKLLQIKCFHPH